MKRTLLAMIIAAGALAAVPGATPPAAAQGQLCIPFVSPPDCGKPPPPPPPPGPPPPAVPPPEPLFPEPAVPCSFEPRVPGRTFVGIVGDDVLAAGPGYRSCALAEQARSGVGIARTSFVWSLIEKEPGTFDLTAYDRYVLDTARHGIKVLPILYYPPAFRSRAPAGVERPTFYPPRDNADFAVFATTLAQRYGRRGTLWAENPDVLPVPVTAWQIWNEPNLKTYWPPRPNARQYTSLLRTASRALKKVDPRAEIVLAGLPDSRLGVPLERYLKQLYRARANRWFDTLGLNAYAPTAGRTMALLRRVRRIMDRHGDRRKPIWMTEVGWATAGPPHPFRAGEIGQANRVRGLIRSLHRHRRRLRVRGLVYFSWIDYPAYRADFWGLHTGLHARDGSPKPGARAFREAATALMR